MHDPSFLPTLNLVVRLLQTLEQSDYEALASGAGQGRLLEAVIAAPGISAVSLARRFGLTRSSVSQAVRRLEACGYLERRPHPHDSRRLQLHPTRDGLALAPLFALHARSRDELVRRELAPGESELLDRLLYQVAVAVGRELRSRGVR